MSCRRALVSFIFCATALTATAQEITLEEVRVEAPPVLPLELPLSKTVDQLIARLRLNDENARALELQKANASSLTTLLELTRLVRIPLGASDSRVDTFMRENYMQDDLNPRESKALFDSPRREH